MGGRPVALSASAFLLLVALIVALLAVSDAKKVRIPANGKMEPAKGRGEHVNSSSTLDNHRMPANERASNATAQFANPVFKQGVPGCHFDQCRDIFPYYTSEQISGKQKTRNFPIPWIPMDGEFSGINSRNNLSIEIDAYYYERFSDENTTIIFLLCYPSAFENIKDAFYFEKRKIWQALKVDNIEGNIVAEKCDQGQGSLLARNFVWHGIAIYRRVNIEDGNFTLKPDGDEGEEEVYSKRITFTDKLLLSYTHKKIELKEGEYFASFNIIDGTKLIVTTKEGRIYEIFKNWNIVHFEEVKINTRSDLTEVDLSSPTKMRHQFAFNKSIWTFPYDIALVDAEQYGVPKNELFPKQQVHVLNVGFYIKIDINTCNFEWKKVGPAVYNRTLKNGTTIKEYAIKYGYIKYIDNAYKDFHWRKVRKEAEKFPSAVGLLDQNQTEGPARGEFSYQDITKKQYEEGVMILQLKCVYADILYGFAKYNPSLATPVEEPAFLWKNDFNMFTGCQHNLKLLSGDVPLKDRNRAIGFEPPKQRVYYFFVGIESNDPQGEFTMDKTVFAALNHFLGGPNVEYYGHQLISNSDAYRGNKAYSMTVQFRWITHDFLKEIAFPIVYNWKMIQGVYDVYQEVYDCPKFKIFTSSVGGRLKLTYVDLEGNIRNRNIGYDYGHTNQGMIDWIRLELGQKRCKLEDVYRKPDKDISHYCRLQ